MTETQEPLVDVGAVTQAAFTMRGRNPDVLSCIANLSNDEVFTPPEFANRMLDTLAEGWAAANDGADIWADSKVTFLDPFTKTGVFLREITKRLVAGLADEIPDLEQRVDHILTKQVFGIGITEITALLARRSLYCSKYANGEHSIAKSFGPGVGFGRADGNVWFERVEHTWVGGTQWVYTADDQGNQVKKFTNGRCEYCNAPQSLFDRGSSADTHAYALTHHADAKTLVSEIFGADVHFDVVVGNPPYQLELDAAGQNTMQIYPQFVQKAKDLDPRFVLMVIKSQWMAGGRGLDDFRKEMLSDRRLATLVDYPNAAEVFPTVGINGGVCYFLWDADHDGDCDTVMVRNGVQYGPHRRRLDEFEVFIRDNRAVDILNKVRMQDAPSFSDMVSARDPFGPALSSNFSDYRMTPRANDIRLHLNKGTTRITGWVDRKVATKNTHLIDAWKVLIPKAGSGREREKTGTDKVLGPPLVAGPQSVCTLTYVVAGPLGSESEANSVHSYLQTRFARFLVSLRKISQDAPRGVYGYLPQQTWDRIWTDAELYEKYGISDDEVSFIESIIRPMGVDADE